MDVSQDVIVREEDCGTDEGAFIYKEDSDAIGQDFAERVEGRGPLENITKPGTRKVLAKAGEVITKIQAKEIIESGIDKVNIRNAVNCKTGIWNM